MKIAYISCHDHEQYSVGYDDEESLLLAFLRGKGIDIVRRVWDDASVDLSVIVPAYNESQRIGKMLEEATRVLAQQAAGSEQNIADSWPLENTNVRTSRSPDQRIAC